MRIKTARHRLDAWIGRPRHRDDGEQYAKFMLWHFLAPDSEKRALSAVMKNYGLFCNFKGERYRCTGVSRTGEILLARDFEREDGYDILVDVSKCSRWGSSAKSSTD